MSPGALVGLLAATQVLLWTSVATLTHSSPPLDVVEGYMWGREWAIATYKHPALPSWVLEASRLATGTVGWPAYLAGQLFVAATYLCVYGLGRELMGAGRAAGGTLLLTSAAFYAWPTIEFNHNVACMPLWAALSWSAWHAVRDNRHVWWVLAGILAAAGMYAKFSTGLLLISVAGWFVWDRDSRRLLVTPGPWIGVSLFAGLIFPLARWLLAHDFAPVHYAAARTQASGGGLVSFSGSLFVTLSGPLLVLAVAGLMRRDPHYGANGRGTFGLDEARGRTFLWAITGGPLALVLIGAIATGSSLKIAWVSSMFNFAGVLAIALMSNRFGQSPLRRIVACALVSVVAVPLGYAAVVLSSPQLATRPLRVNWPQSAISQRFSELWRVRTGLPLHIVGGSGWVAGLVGITALDRPSILSGPELGSSPWISPERLRHEGALIVWQAGHDRLPAYMGELISGAPVGQERFVWSHAVGRQPLVVEYAIVLPQKETTTAKPLGDNRAGSIERARQ